MVALAIYTTFVTELVINKNTKGFRMGAVMLNNFTCQLSSFMLTKLCFRSENKCISVYNILANIDKNK